MLRLARDEMNPEKFHVICMISNPVRYQSRYDLYWKFAEHMEKCGLQLWTVEIAFGNRPHVVTSEHNPRHLQLRSQFELWHKENALNLIAQRLPSDFRYIAWLDCDIEFQKWEGKNAWYVEAMEQMQHYPIVQLFSNCIDMNYEREVMKTHKGFMYMYHQGKPYGRGKYEHWHPGFAWACTHEAWDAMGGLIDWAILGAADNHMAHALIGKVRDSVSVWELIGKNAHLSCEKFEDWLQLTSLHRNYLEKLDAWQARAERYIRRKVGYVPGIINHYFHGSKRNRNYQNRWRILSDNKFNPDFDIARDYQGLWQLVDHGNIRSINLRDGIMKYFRSRNEDSIDAE